MAYSDFTLAELKQRFQLAIDETSNLFADTPEADLPAVLAATLARYLPLAVTPKTGVNVRREISIPGFTNRVKLNEIAVVTRQLATMIDSGLSVVRSLGILAGQVENKELSRILGEVRMEVERGSSLSAACAKHPKVFNTLFVTMVQAGEAGGHLDSVLL